MTKYIRDFSDQDKKYAEEIIYLIKEDIDILISVKDQKKSYLRFENCKLDKDLQIYISYHIRKSDPRVILYWDGQLDLVIEKI